MRLGIIGFGNIATTLLSLLNVNSEHKLDALTILSKPDSVAKTKAILSRDFAGIADTKQVVTDVAALLDQAPDLVVECAGHAAVETHIPPILRAGIDSIVVSIGALSDEKLEGNLRRAAVQGNARLILPAGAVGGIDLLSALRPAGGLEVTYRGIKPPMAWAGTPAEDAIELQTLTKRTVFFNGSARDAARAFPKNANVAATLALAGAGFDDTRAELIADPLAKANTHEYTVTSPLTHYTMCIENQPSAGNVKTSVSTVYSVLREITNRAGPVAI